MPYVVLRSMQPKAWSSELSRERNDAEPFSQPQSNSGAP